MMIKVPYSIRKLAEALAESATDAGVPHVTARCKAVISAYWHRSRVSAASLQWVVDMAEELGVSA